MPSVASMMLKVSRDAARAARSSASRCAAAPARSGSGSGGMTAPDPLLRRSFVAAPLLHRSRLPVRRVTSLPAVRRSLSSFSYAPGKVEFVADDKDLESDEALWDLYERWCRAFNQERSHAEMTRYFGKFKDSVFEVDRNRKAQDHVHYQLELNMFADGKLADQMCISDSKSIFSRPRPSGSVVSVRGRCAQGRPWGH